MRWIFFSLLVANLVVAVWGIFFKQPSQNMSAAYPPASVSKSAVVLSAKDEQGIGSGDELEGSSESRESVLCELVGPFNDVSVAENFQKRLASIDVISSQQEVELPAGASYWVHLAPESSREADFRRLAALQAQEIESYVIGSGELKNAVSLGVFSVESLANARVEALKAAGLEPVKSVFERKEIELWVEIPPEEAKKMSDLTWERMLEGLSSQERRQNFCLPVAS